MDKQKFGIYMDHVKAAFEMVAGELADADFTSCSDMSMDNESSVSIIIGMTGVNKGRMLLETSMETAEVIAEIMNCEPLEDPMDLYFCMAEFANIFSGRAATFINNQYRGSEIRLTPPIVVSGTSLEVTTPNIQSEIVFYKSEYGKVKIDVGFEGM